MAAALSGALLSDQLRRFSCTYRPDDASVAIDRHTASVAEEPYREADPARIHLGDSLTVPGEERAAAGWVAAYAARLQLASVRYGGRRRRTTAGPPGTSTAVCSPSN